MNVWSQEAAKNWLKQ